MAVDKLPNFVASPTPDNKPGPHHQCSIHLNCESVEVLETAYKEAMNGRPSARYIYLPHIRFNSLHSATNHARDTVEGKHLFWTNNFQLMFWHRFLAKKYSASPSVENIGQSVKCSSLQIKINLTPAKVALTI